MSNPCEYNPYEYILDNFYGENMTGMDAAAVLLLRVMADNYKGDLPPGTCADTYVWCLAQLDKYRPNDFIDWMERDWARACPLLRTSQP